MTQDFENMLYLLGCGATGKEPLKEHCFNIQKIREISISQNIWPIVYSAVRKKILSGEISVPDEIYDQLEMSFQANIGKTLQKNEFNKNTIKKLEKNGIECCLFKGIALAALYDIPETRVSGDVDILIKPEKEAETINVLQKLGYSVEKRQKYDHHSSAVHPIGGEMEIHISVMRKNWDDIIFENRIKYNEEYVILENEIKTLGINDALLNVTTHFIKHFVRSGAGVRHIMDMLLYMKHYEEQINWDRFNALMDELHYRKLIDAAKSVGVKYWGFTFEDFESVDAGVLNNFIDDIERSGVFGGKDDARNETYAKFTQRRKKLSLSEYKKYSIKNMDRTLLQKLFPNKEYMKRVHKMKGDSLFSLITAHLRRIWNIIVSIINGKKDFSQYAYGESKKTTQQVKERLNLFESLNIID